MSRYQITKGDEDGCIYRALHSLCLPGDEMPSTPSEVWLVWDTELDQDCGFATVKVVDKGSSAFMQRSGVLKYARGNKLQRRLLFARERWCREQGIKWAITYTTYYNYASIATLVQAGYRFYPPDWNWAGKSKHYYIKEL